MRVGTTKIRDPPQLDVHVMIKITYQKHAISGSFHLSQSNILNYGREIPTIITTLIN